MRLENVSKIYTAALILELTQDEKLRVTDTVARWVPGCCPTATGSRSGSC